MIECSVDLKSFYYMFREDVHHVVKRWTGMIAMRVYPHLNISAMTAGIKNIRSNLYIYLM